jgi:hypothetical protein
VRARRGYVERVQRLDPESIDLLALARHLARMFSGGAEGYIVGRTRLRDAVVERLRCSELQAEELVDTLILRHLIEFSGDPTVAETGAWLIRVHPAA